MLYVLIPQKTDEKLEYITRKIKKLRQKSCSRLQQERERAPKKMLLKLCKCIYLSAGSIRNMKICIIAHKISALKAMALHFHKAILKWDTLLDSIMRFVKNINEWESKGERNCKNKNRFYIITFKNYTNQGSSKHY